MFAVDGGSCEGEETFLMEKILVIEDDIKTANLIQLYLRQAGYKVSLAHDGFSGLDMARNQQPDLVVVDLMLPNLDGLDICRVRSSHG